MSKVYTFANYKGKASFDWNTFLDQETYTRKELDKAVDLANAWVTCACGNQCATIPRDEDGTPLDSTLWNLGMQFAAVIGEADREEGLFDKKRAKRVLRQIEQRSAEILDEMAERERRSRELDILHQELVDELFPSSELPNTDNDEGFK